MLQTTMVSHLDRSVYLFRLPDLQFLTTSSPLELCDDYLFYRFEKEGMRKSWRDDQDEEQDWFDDEESMESLDDPDWNARLVSFEEKMVASSLMHSIGSSQNSYSQQGNKELDTAQRVKLWASVFRRLDPRYRILAFFTQVAQFGRAT